MKMPVSLAAAAVIAAAFGTSGAAPAVERETLQQFDHPKHLAFISDCTTCHAGVRGSGSVFPEPSFCATCHNGSTQPRVSWTPPGPSGANLRFSHDGHPPLDCAQCHGSSGVIQRAVLENCLACHGVQGEHQDANVSPCNVCHVQPPAPATHGYEWREQHAVEAAASPETCGACHVRSDCLDCHKPSAASGSPGYHPAGFLQRHPSSAYNRETECADCHNVAQFCQSCHVQAGLAGGAGGAVNYHDGQPAFLSGHAQMARQNLESCVSCHVERDCLRCHTRINPHGSGFNAETMREKNAQMCAVCHGSSVPDPE
ncbi:MAG: hypothetical protein OER90_10595 [Gemmatimonadota bacterium]|nr:hypothetical protein [Gemmatimonadota bacterium]